MIQGSSFKREAELKLMGKIRATFGHILYLVILDANFASILENSH